MAEDRVAFECRTLIWKLNQIKRDRQCAYNVTSRRVRVTIIAVEKK